MSGYLRQSTAAQARLIGPFVDDTDFKTAETGLTIANTDIKLRANGTTLANKNSGGGTHQVNGMYSVSWDATDTANVGELLYSVVVTGALQVWGVYTVVEEAVYDALFAASAAGFGVAQTGDNFARLGAPAGASVSADVAAVKADTAAILTDTGTTLQAELDGIQADTEDIQARLPAALVTGRMDASVGAMAANVLTATAIAADAITDAKVASDVTIASVTGAVGSVTGAVGSVTGLTASDVGAIKAKTDFLPAAPAAVSDIPTAIQNADALLKRDWTLVTGEAARSVLNALRFLRNKWALAAGTLTVTKEDDVATAWTGAVTTDAAVDQITGVDPA